MSDLKALLDASGPAQHKKNAVPMPPTLQLETKHRVFLCLLRVQLSSSVSDIVESLQLLKQILSTPSSQSPDSIEAQDALLSDESGALQILSLTLLLPVAEVTNLTITILLSLSFSSHSSETFTSQLTYSDTFQVFQHAMLAELTAYE